MNYCKWCMVPEGAAHKYSCPEHPDARVTRPVDTIDVIQDQMDTVKHQLTLDPSDAFEAVLIDMVIVQRSKRKDYAYDGDRWSNFEAAARQIGISTADGIEYMVATKQARLAALRANGRSPENESVADTLLDRAVYSVLALAYLREERNTIKREGSSS